MWDLPGPGLEPVSPALAGGPSTTAPPGKPPSFTFFYRYHSSELYKMSQKIVLGICNELFHPFPTKAVMRVIKVALLLQW